MQAGSNLRGISRLISEPGLLYLPTLTLPLKLLCLEEFSYIGSLHLDWTLFYFVTCIEAYNYLDILLFRSLYLSPIC